MKMRALALDYDGTIAVNGVLDPRVKEAILDVRVRGVVVILVTGRILSELTKVAGDVSFFDAIVAENGAVLSFPNGYFRRIGEPPSELFLAELRRRRVGFLAGECVVDADAGSAPEVLAAVRQL